MLASDRPKRRLGVLAPQRPPLELALERARSLDEVSARAWFAIEARDRALKTTVSLCPACLGYVPALVYERGGRVLMKKRCPEHGESAALVENDARYYFLSNKDRSGVVFARDRVFDIPTFQGAEGCCEGGSCGEGTDQSGNKTCTILVEVTDACNLSCAVCYSDAKGERGLPVDAFVRSIEALVARQGGLDSVQLTGGEALLHPQFFELYSYLCDHPRIKKVYLPTNGLLLLKGDVATRLAQRRDKLMVLLQLDGTTDATDETLRGATPARVRRQVIERLGELGVFMQLTMTLARGVNEDQVGEVVELALANPHVKVVALQPATYSGRYELDASPMDRLTLSDVAKAVARQARRRAREADFVPIPCSHPSCGWITLFLRRFGLTTNIMRFVDLPKVIDNVAYRTLLSTEELKGAVGSRPGPLAALGRLAKGLVRSQDMFTIAIKPFMDRHSYDQDRIDNCCHHLLDQQGVPRSFCEYNALLRQKESWQARPLLSELVGPTLP